MFACRMTFNGDILLQLTEERDLAPLLSSSMGTFPVTNLGAVHIPWSVYLPEKNHRRYRVATICRDVQPI